MEKIVLECVTVCVEQVISNYCGNSDNTVIVTEREGRGILCHSGIIIACKKVAGA